jgi:hypothetical protein
VCETKRLCMHHTVRSFSSQIDMASKSTTPTASSSGHSSAAMECKDQEEDRAENSSVGEDKGDGVAVGHAQGPSPRNSSSAESGGFHKRDYREELVLE